MHPLKGSNKDNQSLSAINITHKQNKILKNVQASWQATPLFVSHPLTPITLHQIDTKVKDYGFMSLIHLFITDNDRRILAHLCATGFDW